MMDSAETEESWDTKASAYERWAEPLTEKFAELAVLYARLDLSGRAIIDVGAGTGALALAAARNGAQVCAIDFADAMVNRLRNRLLPYPCCTAMQMDGQQLDFEAGKFAAAFSMFGVMLFPDWQSGLREMVRVTERGGMVVLGTWTSSEGAGPMPILMNVMRRLFPDLPAPPIPPGMLALSKEAGLRKALREAGCGAIEVWPARSYWGAPSIVDLMRDLEGFLSLVPPYVELAEADQRMVREPLRDAFLKHADRAGRISVPVSALITTGRRTDD